MNINLIINTYVYGYNISMIIVGNSMYTYVMEKLKLLEQVKKEKKIYKFKLMNQINHLLNLRMYIWM